ncbi:hypothetical protein E2P81_ATG09143 [Venturia nashicola]|nr:hypothetical protein E2P81_ATG09143 [Venturia nashicola]
MPSFSSSRANHNHNIAGRLAATIARTPPGTTLTAEEPGAAARPSVRTPLPPLPAVHGAMVMTLVYPPNILRVVVCGPGNVVKLPTSLVD